MKKFLTIALILILALCMGGLFACGNGQTNTNNSEENNTHTHSFIATVTNPTCTEQGYTTYTCTCGYSYKDNFTIVLEHNFINTKCTVCEQEQPTKEIIYSLSADKTYYTATTITNKDINQLIIADFYNGLPVKEIGCGAFAGCETLKSVTVSRNIITIGTSAFESCSNLEQIKLPEGLKSIKSGAFNLCNNLSEINLPNGLEHIGGLNSLERLDLNIYDNAKYLGSDDNPYLILVKAINTSITNCEIHPDTKFIQDWAFDGCNNLIGNIYDNAKYLGTKENPYLALIGVTDKTITNCSINPNAKFILGSANGNGGFGGCELLQSVTIPASVETIGIFSFWNCTSLNNVDFANGLKSIEYYAFYCCTSLSNLKIPSTVQNISPQFFIGCSSLANIVVDKDNAYFSSENGVLYNKTQTELIACPVMIEGELVISSNDEYISLGAFYSCTLLQNIVIPNSIQRIETFAFSSTTFTSIIFNGTKEQWNNIEKGDNWNYGTGNYTIYCTDGEIPKA